MHRSALGRSAATYASIAALAVGMLAASPAGALASGGSSLNCTGGPIPAGTYSSLTVSGACLVDAGNVSVSGNLTVAPGGELLAAFAGSNLWVGGNLIVDANGVLVLGCEPFAFTCLNDPTNTLAAHGTVGGNLTADGALAVLVHNTAIGRNLAIDGGGGGVNCAPQAALMGSPAYATFEDVKIGGNAVIENWHSCWLGLFRTTVGRNVNFSGNIVADPDGNEVATNTIGGNLNCSGNSPAPQVGDSGGAPNTVGRKATGQCVGLTS